MSKAISLEKAFLYLITPARPKAGELVDLLPRVLDAGVDVVQLREKTMEARPLLRYCEVVRKATSEFSAVFIVNDRVDVAVAAGADGVHLGQDDLSIDQARKLMGNEALIGLSTHSEDQVVAGNVSGADYIAVGPVYETPTKPGRPAVGPSLPNFAAGNCEIPWFAIGGIDLTTLPSVLQAGAKRIAILRAITEADNPPEAVRKMKALLLG